MACGSSEPSIGLGVVTRRKAGLLSTRICFIALPLWLAWLCYFILLWMNSKLIYDWIAVQKPFESVSCR